ncbi:type IV secretion system protein [Sphingomonas sp. MMS12-HWE2-04]|uniref:type IV secretion system protein n=1 Tax=Sphingomonas sp. MMS12-HWE2-04 TaxID=3234199 RepID=UPI00384D2A48
MSCPGIADTDFLASALRFADCQAQTIGMQGYQALAAGGSPVGALLTGLLTILIALLGYRMLLGHVPDGREGVLTFVRIGLVLALSTSWAAYRVTIYDIVLHGPAEILGSIGGASDIPGATGGMISRLGAVDRAMTELSRLGISGNPAAPANASQAPGNEQAPAASQSQSQYDYEPATIFGSSSMGSARLIFLTATIAAYASVRLVAGLLLAIGPLFIAFLLFEGTRSLFEGWVRALVAASIGALTVTMTLGVELALLEPWLTDLLNRRYMNLSTSASATELLVVGLAFALILLGALAMAARLALAFRLPLTQLHRFAEQRAASERTSSTASTQNRTTVSGGEPSRAMAVAEAVAVAQRREGRAAVERSTPTGTLAQSSQRARDTAPPNTAPLGQGYRRRSQSRVSASSSKRDVRA